MDAIVLAGGKAAEKDPLYEMTSGGLKSMLKIAGKPMIQWVLDALSASEQIESIVVMGIEDGSNLSCQKVTAFLPDTGTLIENIQQGCAYLDRIHPNESHVITISADIPTVTSTIIDQCIKLYREVDFDVCYAVIERSVMENRFPNSKRTYIKVMDGKFCGGDLNCLRKKLTLNPAGLWKKLIQYRKNPIKQAALIGFDTLFMLALGKLTLAGAAQKVCRRMGFTGKAFSLPYAEVGMDVDKPFQFEIVEKDLMR